MSWWTKSPRNTFCGWPKSCSSARNNRAGRASPIRLAAPIKTLARADKYCRSHEMPSNPYAAHIEASVLTAEPVELVRSLYRGALDAVGDARACAAESDAAGRSAAVSKAVNILRELAFSLDPASEPGMARNLLELYDYMQRRLLAAQLER